MVAASCMTTNWLNFKSGAELQRFSNLFPVLKIGREICSQNCPVRPGISYVSMCFRLIFFEFLEVASIHLNDDADS